MALTPRAVDFAVNEKKKKKPLIQLSLKADHSKPALIRFPARKRSYGMKLKFAILSLIIIFLIGSCNKNSGNDPVPPGDTVVVGAGAVIEQLTYRHIVDSELVEEIYSIKYDAKGNMTEIRREDQDRLSTKFLYAGDQLASVTVYTTAGSVGATYINNQSLFIKEDMVSFWFTRDLSPGDPIDTVRSEYVFTDSVIDRATFTIVSPLETRRYSGLIYDYDERGNVEELGFTNTDGVYNTHLTITSVDDKKNPVRGSMLSFAFFFSEFNAELHMGLNNITGVQYGNGEVAQFDYTYNGDGYPLTIKDPSANFTKFEFRYKP